MSTFIETYTITSNVRYRQLVNILMLISTLAILRGTFDNFRPLSLTTTTCVNLYGDLPLISYYFERELSPTFEHYNVSENPHNPSGYFSVTFDQHRCLLRLALIFIGILRGTFGNFRPLSFTTSACVNLERHLPLLRTHAIANLGTL